MDALERQVEACEYFQVVLLELLVQRLQVHLLLYQRVKIDLVGQVVEVKDDLSVLVVGQAFERVRDVIAQTEKLRYDGVTARNQT